MRDVVEKMDSIRTWFLRIFSVVSALLLGFWIFYGLALAFLRPKTPLDSSARTVWQIYIDFGKLFQPALEISSFIALAIFSISLFGWFLYKRKLARNPAIETAVRDERVRFIWLLSFRKTVTAVIVLQFILWFFQDLSPLFFGRYPIEDFTYISLTFFVLIVTSFGAFLVMDRYRTGIAIFRLAPFERVIIRKAPSLLSMYLGWHILYIIGTIYRNSRFLKIIHADDDPRLQRSLYSVRAGWIFWIGILAILALFLLVRSPKAGRDVVNAILPDDERIQMNWLRACRLSFLFVLMLLLASRLISIIYYVIFHYVWNDRPPAQLMTSLFNWQYILSDLKIILLTAVVTLLGSYHHYDNKY